MTQSLSSITLPPGWAATTLGDVVEGGISQLGPQDESFLYVDISSIDNKTKRVVDPKHLPRDQAPSRARQCLTSGDVIVSMTRPNLNAVALLPESMADAIGSTGFHVLRATASVPQFLFYLVQSHDFVEAMTKLVQGALYPAVRPKDINNFGFALPPLPEQHRIVAEIERQFSLLDAGVANLQRVQASLKRYRAAVLQAACTGQLVPTEAETARAEGRPYEPADVLLTRILAERRARWEAEQLAKREAQGKLPLSGTWKAKYQEPAAPDTSGLPELPEGWVLASIGQISECLDYKRVPINKEERLKRQGSIPYFGANGQVGWIDDYLFDEPLVLVLEDETFTGREKPFSYKIAGRTWVNNHAHVLRATDAVYVDYLNYSLCYYPFTPLTTGTTGRKKLVQARLMSAPYGLPPLAEQERIVAEVERRLSVVENLEQVVKANLKRAERLRQAVLKEAFAGRLVPQYPADEPASVLLERIKAEREAQAKAPARAGRRKEIPDADHRHDDAAGKAVPSGHARRQRGTADQARLQPDLFSANGG